MERELGGLKFELSCQYLTRSNSAESVTPISLMTHGIAHNGGLACASAYCAPRKSAVRSRVADFSDVSLMPSALMASALF